MTKRASEQPVFSVVVPHLNQPAFLERLIASLKQQSYPQDLFEVVVVDNGSTPDTLDTVRQLIDQAGYRLEQEAEPGPGPARNRGIETSRQDYFAFIDADCVAAPGWLVQAAACLAGNPDRVYGGDVRILGHEAKDLSVIQAYESVFAYQQFASIHKHQFCLTGNLVAHRKTLEKVGRFAGLSVAEDRDWGRRAIAAGIEIHYIADMIVYHPARAEMTELQHKWKRHIQHDWKDMALKAGNRDRVPAASWLFRMILVLGSIPVHTFKILGSKRISGPGNRFRAVWGLVSIRLFRLAYMLAILTGRETLSGKPSWNRE